MSTEVMNYDPNLLNCGKVAEQTVKLTFGDWHYRAEIEVVVGGNLRGLDVIEAAIEKAFGELFDDEDGFAAIIMNDADGNELEDDQGDDEEWLKSKLIKAEIVAIEPTTWQKIAMFLLYKLNGTARVTISAADIKRCAEAFSPGVPTLLVHGKPDSFDLQVIDQATAEQWANYEQSMRGTA